MEGDDLAMSATIEPTVSARLTLGERLRRNPIALKELRGRMRGARTFIVLTIYVALMSGFTVLLYLIYAGTASMSLSTTGGVVGKVTFSGVVVIEMFLVCLVTPAFTSGAISGERERRTFDLLRTTLLPARRIVIGKLMSAMAYILLLLLTGIPLQSMAFLMGGVTTEEVVLAFVLLVVAAIGFGMMGLFFSAIMKRTLSASVLTYVLALVVIIGLPLIGLIVLPLVSSGLDLDQPVLEAIILYLSSLLAATNPVTTAVLTETLLLSQGTVFVYKETLSNGAPIPLVSPWIIYTILYLSVSLVLIAVTVRQVRKVES